jgi:hypothetical protein
MLDRLFHKWEVALSRRDTNRRVLPFDWGLEFVGRGDCTSDPKAALMEHTREVLARSDDYYSYQPVETYRLEDRHLTFPSPIATKEKENNTVHVEYFPIESRGRAVLVLPQWNADAQGHMALCRMLNSFGLSAARLSLPYHDLRMPAGLERADYMLSPNLGRTLLAIRQAVIDARATLDWLQQQGYRKFAVLGTSLGSCVGQITLAHDSRLKVSVQNHVSPYFADVVWTGISTRYVRAGLEDHISLEDLRRIWMPISPMAYCRKLIGPQRSLLIHAKYDRSFLPHLSRMIIREYGRLGLTHWTLRIPCGHYSSGKFPFNLLLGFAMCRFLRKNLG